MGFTLFRSIWFIPVFIGSIAALSFNQPKFCGNATWNATARTVANVSVVGVLPYGLFVNQNNTLYVANRELNRIVMWGDGATAPTRNFSGNISTPYTLFVAEQGDIYFDNGATFNRVDKWSMNSSYAVPALFTCGRCYGIFIDILNNLYCSLFQSHQVVSTSLDSRLNLWSVVAGTGAAGSSSTMLYNPSGIYVDQNLNLYVADCTNDRIQRFRSGQLNGTTVVGSTAPGTYTLDCPTEVKMDADGYLFIADCYNNRVIGSGPSGYRCIVGCSSVAGSAASQLYYPSIFAFDTYGNLFISDQYNNRIQKFDLLSNGCSGGMTTATTTALALTSAMPTNNVSSSNNPPVVSYNMPRFNPLASWNPNAITVATIGTVGGYPYGIFVNANNTLFVANRESSRVQIWSEGQSVPTRNITTRLSYPFSIFATVTGDIYVDNGYTNQRVDVWGSNAINGTSAMFVKRACYGLFIDISNTLHCSMYDQHQVVATSLNTNSNIWTISAGSDCSGSTSNRLYFPWGIFVDFNLNLYVADFGNDRVQLFSSGQVTGTTVAGITAPGTITLYRPTGVILDGDGYLFIVDSYNHRIVVSGPNGFRCIVGCGGYGSGSNQLYFPVSMSFDSYGNMFVADRDNHRIQKFNLVPMGTPNIYYNQPQLCPSTTWNPDAITFANSSVVGVAVYGMFVGRDNTVYIPNREASVLRIWLEGSILPDRNITAGLSLPMAVFANTNGDIYIDNGVSNFRIDRWTSNGTVGTVAMTIPDECYNMFLDRSNFLYCAATFSHQVVKRWLGDNVTTSTRVAGTGGAGSAANMLIYPVGVYVDSDFNLYVGDCDNNRVQKFGLGQSDGVTVVGAAAPGTITLWCPTSLTFDANGYMFIVDCYNHRLIGSGPLGFRCIFGCSATAGSTPSQLYYPRGFSFDIQGNIFVAEQGNSRAQKVLLVSNSCTLSYNQPKFCVDATWTVNGTSLLTNTTLGVSPYSIFLDGINTIYVTGQTRATVFIWPPGTSSITRNVSGNFNRSSSLFVSINGDIYVDNGFVNGRVDRWNFNSSTMVPVLSVNGSCSGLFVDQNNSLFCSLVDFHRVVRIFLGNDPNSSTTAAGTGVAGATANMLDSPQGIYVDAYFNLYVADCGNDRVQLFASMQSNGVTVAGNGSSATIPLDCPTSIALDADGYLFIVDSFNHRIIGSGPYGFRCVIGCSGMGSAAFQLSFPQNMAFDSYGNMFVTDRNNNRVQRYMLQKTACVAATTIQPTAISTTNLQQTSTIPSTQRTVVTTAGPTGSISTPIQSTFANVQTTVVSTAPVTTGVQTTGTAPVTRGGSTGMSSASSSSTTTTTNPTTGIIGISQGVSGSSSTVAMTSISPQESSTMSSSTATPRETSVTAGPIQSTVITSRDNSVMTTTASSTAINPTTGIIGTSRGVSGSSPIVAMTSISPQESSTLASSTATPRETSATTGSGLSPAMASMSNNGTTTTASSTVVNPNVGTSATSQGVSGSSPTVAMTSISPQESSMISSSTATPRETSATAGPSQSAVITSRDNSAVATTGSSTAINPTTGIVGTSQGVIGSSPIVAMTSISSQERSTMASSTTTPREASATASPDLRTAMTSMSNNGTTKVASSTAVNPSAGMMGTSPSASLIAQTTASASTVARNNTTMGAITPANSPTASVSNTSGTVRPTSGPVQATSSLQTDTMTRLLPMTSSSMVDQSCLPPTITFVPDGPTWASPIHHRRRQELSITSSFEFHCNGSFSTVTEWIITSCNRSTCSLALNLSGKVNTRSSELFVPSRTLAIGTYQMALNVQLTDRPRVKASPSVYVQITPSDTIANLFPLGTSMITQGSAQDLVLNPGRYSIDPDEDLFDASNWNYEYYCRIYGVSDFPMFQGTLLPIDDSRSDPLNPSCLSNRTDNQTGWRYDNSSAVLKSSLRILAGSFRSNRTYQFRVSMTSRRNSSIQVYGNALVSIEGIYTPLIIIGCVISALCDVGQEFQRINPTTQVALSASCIGMCDTQPIIQWNVYYGVFNVNSNVTQWLPFSQMMTYDQIWFFGRNTNQFTSTNRLFVENPAVQYWRFEVIYRFASAITSSALNFVMNRPPSSGSCSISPSNGTTSTLFTITCSAWSDENGIKDYSIYGWSTGSADRMLISYSPASSIQTRLPAGDRQTSLLHLLVSIRDQLECVTEVNISSVHVRADTVAINSLIESMTSLSSQSTNNALVQLLSSGNQNTVGQVISAVSQQVNQLNSDNINQASASGIPLATIAISGLNSAPAQATTNPMPLNDSAVAEYRKDLNAQSTARGYLITVMDALPVTTLNSIKLQSTCLSQLTEATNQLSRAALIIAAKKCSQLTSALYSLRTQISYEDVQSTSNALVQIATNIISAVNGPLQGRTFLLDTDVSRANELPKDYETDLESPWSNPNLFAEGNDFSAATIARNRNLFYQNQLANDISSQMKETISLLSSTLSTHLNLGQSFALNTSRVVMSLETISLDSLANKSTGNSPFQLPQNLQLNATNNQSVIAIRSMMEPLASFGNSKVSPNTNNSRSVSLTILDANGREIPVATSGNETIEIRVPRDPNLPVSSFNRENVTAMNDTTHHLLFNLHYVNITSQLPISFHLEMQPLNRSLAYLFIYRFDQSPQLNSSISRIDGWTIFCPSNSTNETLYRYFLDNRRTVNHQSLIFGLRELNWNETLQFCFDSFLNTAQPPITSEGIHFTADYELRIYTAGCYYVDTNNNWKSDGLIVGPMTNYEETQCFSTHLTTFAGGFIVLPKPINWSYVFANADFMKNKTVYLTIITVSTLYIILLIYGRYKDKKDIEKLGVTPMPDNNAADQYFYQVLVFTGRRANSGTKSNVHFILSGDHDQTSARTFADPHRKILQRGGIDAFVMSVPRSLGLLNCIRIWHDSSGPGKSASWFLKYIIVQDIQTMQKFHFIAQRWFAVEEDDGQVERVLPAAGEVEKGQLSYVLSKKAYHSVSDGHLWFSIFSRPPSDRFTRVQRCTCCFVLLFISMLLNIMYYDVSNEAKSANQTENNGLSIGPLYITPQQIGIGVMVEILSLFPSLLIVQLFRRLRARKRALSPLRQALAKMNIVPPRSETVTTTTPTQEKKKGPLTFPWWCIFIAYTLSYAFIAISILFIIARGIEFGDLKTQKWLTSILTGFFSSILFTQPIKILVLAVLFSCFCRNINDDNEANQYFNDEDLVLNNDEEYLHNADQSSLYVSQPMKDNVRLSEHALVLLRAQRLKEIQMWTLIREFAQYFIFVSLVCTIIYASREENSFLQVQHLRSFLLNPRETDSDYSQIYSITQLWHWLDTSFVQNLRAQEWYNGEIPRNLNGFMDDKANRLLGWATMRQLRVKPKSCDNQRIVSRCIGDYNWFSEEQRSYKPGWSNETNTTYSSSIQNAFQFRSSNQLDTYLILGQQATYFGGGYVYEFRGRLAEIRSNLSLLHQLGWINNHSRAVIIQLTLYNPNVQLMTAVTLLLEISPSGGVSPSSRFEPITFSAFTSLLQMICILIYILFIIYFLISEIRSLMRLKRDYFRQFWSWIEMAIIFCSLGCIVVYFWRFKESKRLGTLFEKTNGYAYVNLQLAVYVNDVFTFLFGFCCFFANIKFIRLFRSNPRLSLFVHTLRIAAKELLYFAVMFSIVFFSFLALFHLLFVSNIADCSTMLGTAQMLFEITLMKFDVSELLGASAVIGPVVFTFFIILVVFVCLSMFLSIINQSFRLARQNIIDNEHMFTFMMTRFLRWTGLKRTTAAELYEARDAHFRSQYVDPIEYFPNRIDQLLTVLNRIYVEQRADLSRLDRISE